MVNSMTAYARAELDTPIGRISCEMRTVNHRYLDIALRLPEDMRGLEPPIREMISEQVKRGKIEINIRLISPTETRTYELNQLVVNQLIQCYEKLQPIWPQMTQPNWLDLLRWPGMMEDKKFDEKTVSDAIFMLLKPCLDELLNSRKREGAKLEQLIVERLMAMEKIVKNVQQLLPDILATQKEKLLARLTQIQSELDQNRLEQEMLYLAQRMDVDEELQRLLVHIDEINKTLKRQEPIGRRLDFLMQELNREANTLASKSVHSESSGGAVELKVLIEQMREQVQNIE